MAKASGFLEGIAIGDLHLGVHDSHGIPSSLTIETIRPAFDHAEEEGLPVFLLGDTFDTHRSSLDDPHYMEFAEFLNRYTVPIHIIAGNHDQHEGIAHAFRGLLFLKRMGVLENVFIYMEPTVVVINGKRVNFLPYPHRAGINRALNIGHIDRAGSRYCNGYVVKEGSDDEYQWIIGHNHTKQQVRSACFPGTPVQVSPDENHSFGYTHFRYGSTFSADHIPLKQAFKIQRLKLATPEIPEVDDDTWYAITVEKGVPVPQDLYSRVNVYSLKGGTQAKEKKKKANKEPSNVSREDVLKAAVVAVAEEQGVDPITLREIMATLPEVIGGADDRKGAG